MSKSLAQVRIETQIENVKARSQRAESMDSYLHDIHRLQELQSVLNALITGEERAVERMRGR